VPAENVGRRQLVGHPFLSGVDDLGAGCGGGDLRDVPQLDRIAENDSWPPLGHEEFTGSALSRYAFNDNAVNDNAINGHRIPQAAAGD
jgi:hypothetical protein